ncbi:MAG TPA: sigma 54-interacting transcriptional regulator, partial [Dissulfurispiraceae bacterium]|nr:sigma 54-interacting transcriptional regulator [Dissulfurispiraceae bacterium]
QLVAQIFANALARKRADRALRESEERLNLAAASARAGLWSLDPASGHVWATEKGKELIGFGSEQELDFESFLEMVHPEDRDQLRQTVQRAMQSKEDASAEYRVLLPDGSIRWFLSRGHPYTASPEEPSRLMGVTLDITGRKHAEEALKASEAKYRQLHESMMDAFVSVNMDGRFLEFNEVYRKMLGYTREELLPLTYRDLTPEKWHASENDIIENQVLLRGYSDIYEKEYRRKDGEILPVELRTILLRDNDGRPKAMWAIVRDITERKRMEQQLRDRLREIEELRQQVERENIYLRQSAKLLFERDMIVGESEPLKRVLAQAEQVAPTDSTVLLLGETGTGKELVAQIIHDLSRRKERVMVKVNCASLPAALIESELFGREKGAYTGALTRQIGRFELADGSTIFLDEIAELPLELQVKLLRVLEEGTLERLGSPKTIKVDVRVIAASNHDLLAAVRAGTFREDLYYRLNVFPIEVPPLRERPDDIPLLVEAFVSELSRKMAKKIALVPRRAVEALQRYHWPGNVRELRNVIEQAIILSDDGVLNVQMPRSADTCTTGGVSLEEAEYMHITGVLQKTGWRIKGRDGAAELLCLRPSTLYTKMEKLGIPKKRDKNGT